MKTETRRRTFGNARYVQILLPTQQEVRCVILYGLRP